ncbi:MAG: transcriptional regulator [Thermoleophilia bacterium]
MTNALSDPTRYAIYRALVDENGRYVTVADIAEKFTLHPNVARMHLQKLVDVGLVETDTRKSPAGGRPARIYRLTDRVANLQFPPRDYRLLASLALQVVENLASEKPDILEEVGREIGREEGRKVLGRLREIPAGDTEEMLKLLEETCTSLGLFPRVTRDGKGGISIEVRNCVFRELSTNYPKLVCALHEAMLQGLLEAFLPEFALEAEPAICRGEGACHFAVGLGG